MLVLIIQGDQNANTSESFLLPWNGLLRDIPMKSIQIHWNASFNH